MKYANLLTEETENALKELRNAFYKLSNTATDEEWDILANKYPFKNDFEEVTHTVNKWVEQFTEERH